ncbi:sarcosine dehydrogenase, mitochondrial-like [Scylla paramamosain]
MWRRAMLHGSLLLHLPARTTSFLPASHPTFTTFMGQAKKNQGGANQDVGGLPGEVDVVVVGGGVLGCSSLYHLAKLGVTNTILLEAHELTAGTTWHTAGLMSTMGRSETDYSLRNTTLNMLRRLEEETGVSPGLIENGSVYISSTRKGQAVRKDEFARWVTFMRVLGCECELITLSQLKDLYPLVDTSDINAVVHVREGGQMDPAGTCEGLTRWAMKQGARVVKCCPVTDIRTTETLLGGRRVSEVHTNQGVIKTNAVINATGSWGNYITSMVGVTLPLQSFRHGYVVTEGVEGLLGMPVLRDLVSSAYLKAQGDSAVIGYFEPNPEPIDQIRRNFPFGLYEMNWDIYGPIHEQIIQRIPILENVGIKSTIVGPESFTPDGRAIMGEDPNVQGFFHCCGFNSHGMQYSGGCGDQLAKWVIRGEPELDLFGFDVRRFHPPLIKNKSWVLARSQECLSSNYSIVFPHDEPLAGRGQRLSPLHQELEAAGSVFQERNGWERPGWFHSSPVPVLPYDYFGAYDHTPAHADHPYYSLLTQDNTFDFPVHHDVIQQECIACRERAAVFDMTSFGKYYLTGPDAQRTADWVFSANMTGPAGSTIYTCMLNERGGVEADLTVSVCEGGEGTACDPSFEGRGFYITTGGSTGRYCAKHILKEARSQGWLVDLEDRTEDLALISVQGPHSRDILQQLTHEDLADSSFPFSSHKTITLAGHSLRALRLSFVGELGWELHVPRDSALAVYRSLMDVGKSWGITNAGFRAIDSLSCEKGYRHWHGDVRPDDTPLEAGLAFTCKLNTQTNFKGRAALECQRKEGISKKLVTLTLEDGSRPLWGLEAIVRDGEVLGYVRRAEYAFSLGRAIAYGYVRRPEGGRVTKEFLSSGTWQLEVMGKRLPASLHLKPPFDPQNLRVKGIYGGQ